MGVLKDDFKSCLQQFRQCGGRLKSEVQEAIDAKTKSQSEIIDEVVNKALSDSANDVSGKMGRSVGDHGSCTQTFDKKMLAQVVQKEQSVIDKYKLGTCCSSDPKMIQISPMTQDASPLSLSENWH